MKVAWCQLCGDMFGPGTKSPNFCTCGKALAKWVDPEKGTLRIASKTGNKRDVRFLGILNSWLRTVLTLPEGDGDEATVLHKHWAQRRCEDAHGSYFKLRECPIIMGTVDEDYVRFDMALVEEAEKYFNAVRQRIAEPAPPQPALVEGPGAERDWVAEARAIIADAVVRGQQSINVQPNGVVRFSYSPVSQKLPTRDSGIEYFLDSPEALAAVIAHLRTVGGGGVGEVTE